MAFLSKCSASATNFFIAVYTLYGSVTGFGMKGKKPTCTLGTHDSHTCPSLKIFKYYRQWSCISDATNDELNKIVFWGLLVIYQEFRFYSKIFRKSRDFCNLKSQIFWQGSVLNLITFAKGVSFLDVLFVYISRTSHLTQNRVTDYLKNILFCKVIS